MRLSPVRLVEAVGAAVLYGLAARIWVGLARTSVVGVVFVNYAAAGLLGVALATVLALDAALGVLAPGILERSRRMPYTLRLGRLEVRVGSPEALLLSLPFWAASAAALASAVYSVETPTFLAQLALELASVAAAAWLTAKALTEDPLSLHVRRAGAAGAVAPRLPWYSRLARLTVAGSRPLQALAARLESLGVLGWLERRASEALKPYTRRELALILASGGAAGLLAGAAASLALAALGVPAALALAPLPAGALAAPLGLVASIEASRSSRAAGAEEEAAWLALAGSSSARAGLGLHYALERLSGPEFPALSRERAELARRMEALGEDPLEALRGLGRGHPSATLRELLTGYVDLLLGGGDPVRYLGDWVRGLLQAWRSRLAGSAEEAAALAEALIALLALGPVVAAVGGLLLGGAAAAAAVRALVLGATPAGLALAALLALRTPGRRARYDPRRPAAAAALAASAAFLALALAGRLGPASPPWLQLGVPALAAMLGWHAAWRIQDAQESEEERLLPYILRRLAEARRLGRPLLQSLEDLARELAGRGARHASTLLAEQASTLSATGALEPSPASRSWLWRASFRVLAALEAAGGATAGDVEGLRRFVEAWMEARRDAAGQTRLAGILSAAAPLIGVWAIDFTRRALEGVAAMLSRAPILGGPSLTPPPPGAFEAAKTAVMLSSIGLAAVISRLETGTFYDMKLPIIAALTSLTALTVL
ncbi:MAG: hypothetical protein GSR80_000884 [Desulfurococcales archaeon]|nr:hypothetical protein [Desulfurococcales archaeon]